jgi:hypothetical protein
MMSSEQNGFSSVRLAWRASCFQLLLFQLHLKSSKPTIDYHSTPSRLVAMPPPTKLHQLRSPRYSSREFVVCKRKPVSPRLVVSCPLGTSQQFSTALIYNNKSLILINSDGIARVHGMNNVQAEELVEYVELIVEK